MNTLKALAAATLMAVTLPLATPAMAQEFPLVAGDYAEVSGIVVKDGGAFKYAEHLASQWVAGQEFAKSKGWISDYKIYYNLNARKGEPTIYLMTMFASMPDAAEQDRQAKAYAEWAKRSNAQLEAESGNRTEFRTIQGSQLLQEYTPR